MDVGGKSAEGNRSVSTDGTLLHQGTTVIFGKVGLAGLVRFPAYVSSP